ncbi:MAG: NAD-binding protein, partial [Armatimonadota bacterium]
ASPKKEFIPHAVRKWNSRGINSFFGDAEDMEFPESLPLSKATWLVSAIPDENVNRLLMQSFRTHGFTGHFAMTAAKKSDVNKLKSQGADIVFLPFADASTYAVDYLIKTENEIKRRAMDILISNLKDHYIICGYGRMGKQIAKDFSKEGVPFVVIENNPIQIPKLIEQNIPYIDAVATDDNVLIEAGIEKAKGLVSVNPTDEENVFIVLTARSLNPNMLIVARSILGENEAKLKRAGADRVISPYVLGGRSMSLAVLKPRIMEFIDSVIHSDTLDMDFGHYIIEPNSSLINKTLREGNLRENTGITVLAVWRPDGVTFSNPDPDLVLKEGDELIVMGTKEQLDSAENYCCPKEQNKNLNL